MSTCGACGSAGTRTVATGIRDWEYGVDGVWDYEECPSCLAIRLHPFPTVEELKKAYEIPYHGHVNAVERGWLTAQLLKIDALLLQRSLRPLISPGARVLDVGCGAGGFLERLRSLGAGALEGLDFSPKAVAMGRAKGLKIHEGLFLQASLDNGAYDLVTMNNYLEHTLDPAAELAKARAVLKPSGVLLGEVPGFDAPERGLLGRYWGGHHAPRHTHQFTRASLHRALTQAGWVRIRIWSSPNPVHLALGLQNFLERKTDPRTSSRLRHGRAGYFPLLLLASLPFHLAQMLLGRSGVLKFSATA